MIKLIVSDMDGTLLDGEGKIPEELWTILPELTKKEIKFAIATGRQYATLKDMFSKSPTDIIFVPENGGMASYQENTFFVSEMVKDDLSELVQISRDQKESCFVISGEKSAYIEQPSNENSLKEIQKYFHALTFVDDLTQIDDKILKMTVYNPLGSEQYISPGYEKFKDMYEVVLSGKCWIDICNPDSNKGNAIEKIKKYFGFGYDEVMLFGDHLNDSSMMSCGKRSYAMKNGHSILKEQANFETQYTNLEYGVVKTIKAQLGL